MNTKSFLDLLSKHQEKELSFETPKGEKLPPSFHLTEVKKVSYETMDCGGQQHEWQETLVQLWVPSHSNPSKVMSTDKASQIFNKVHASLDLEEKTDILFEFQLQDAPLASYSIQEVYTTFKKITVKLQETQSQCKAKDRAFSPLISASQGCCGSSKSIGCC